MVLTLHVELGLVDFGYIWQRTNHSWSTTSTCALTLDKKSIGNIIFKGTSFL